MQVSNEKELAEAIENGENSIEIVGDFSKKIVKIKATGDVAWGIAIAAIAAAVAIVIASGGLGAPASLFTAAGAVGILGTGPTISAVTIAVAAGGVGVLNKLRGYDLKKISDSHVVLTKA
ncbi:hypothetical protein [Helicobacter heilmannii]|uniref:hypothetical protein n=1 Tax=Helicobacter heilmannii TaxID=35817 RepID=UPI0006A0459B|nr:hypothetical protein [Helicobacter heilmannii]CRF45128.1 hypothetical protein HHE014_00790 [Helicobacter heilmannii]